MAENQVDKLTDPGDNRSQHNDQDQPKTLRDFMNPTRTGAPSCIVYPLNASHFHFRPSNIQVLPNFHGLEIENPYLHLREFEEVCNTYSDTNCSMNTIRLKLFPFFLKDKVKTWLQNLRQMVEIMCNGEFSDKDPEEELEYLYLLDENAQNWDTAGTHETPSKAQPPTSGGGMYNLKEEHDLQARFASLARKVEALEQKKCGHLKYIQEIVCHICDANDHSTNDCPNLPAFKEHTLAKFASAITIHEKEKFPSQPQPNPKGQYNLDEGSSGSQHMDQVKSVITLCNGKVVEKHILEPCEKDDESVSKGKKGVDEPTPSKEKTKFPLAPPFPHALNNQKKLNHNSEIYEMFKQVKINIPLLDVIKQVSVILQNNNGLKLNGIMNLSFGNMTLELNVFNMCKQPRDEEYESEETNMIGVIIMENKGWKPKFEELGHIDRDKHEEVPKLELNSGKDVEFEEAAKNLGKVLAKKRMHLVYGGGNLGLMGCVSKAAHEGGSQVLGVIPKALASCDIIEDTVGECFILPLARQILVTASTAHLLIESLEAFVPQYDHETS
ncbi:hypothetical protein EZV62_015740 [Acer yangbiense]|uniref:Uncharacterized protein n=1 Tax=Acer yangbiense TaxID=1000413 RepID=A0A5C7HLN5_9ROSI|nr:hypothetical protein EZV62_015740 [Acer yangbiense]